jgi:hypothetical protein
MKTSKLLIFLLATTFCQNAFADEILKTAKDKKKDEEGIITVSLENDSVFNSDSNYTSGIRIGYMSPEEVPNWLEKTANFLPVLATNGNKRWGFAVGQSIFTPKNTELHNPPLTDRPYAGWLYGTATLVSDNVNTLDTFQLTLGMIGPSSLGETAQDEVHHMRNISEPQGWDYQLKDEPGIVVRYDRKWRGLYELSPFGLGFDITPNAGANLGNIDTSASVGLTARLGRDLPSDYGPPLIKPSVSGSDFFEPNKKFGWYFFAGLEGRAVAQNIFLDGNSFTDSRSVDKNILVGGVQGGLALTFNSIRIAYTMVHRTKEFDGQNQPEEYGAVNVSYRF